MRAIVLREFGAAGCLRPEEVPSPAGRPGDVVVRLRASALNWHDVLVRQGRYGSPLPHVPGADGAGVLDTGEEVVILPSLGWGAGEAAPASGFEILGDHRPGTYAEAVSVPAENVVAKPAGYSWAQAAALPLVGVTAFRALFSRAGLRRGESLLVLGAGGGVATTAVLLGSAAGATVCVTSSSEAKIERAREIGAAAGVRYTEPDWAAAARALAPGGEGFDVVLDPVGAWQDSLRALKPGGRLVVLGASRAEQVPLDVRSFYFGQFSLLGTTMGSPRDFAALLGFLAEHDVPPPVLDRTFPLDEAAAAHEYLESGDGFGKVVLTH
ncbi:alcohol dehydrogenase [Amycolatopsis sp. NBRC 101858]|uniref:zinc-binding dehydrogenase n=1 Tax=Amycolatopsis sp. NBRC 101858 TaxID=3032200 RepID=UPI0024A37C00|nr:zinc-binding dehydrogenase [Amycolatopsis sp. NBRC 101858]GLY40405.1 alcohol dehydrogenase [Amycolatopsis sp. NBRC 101858]